MKTKKCKHVERQCSYDYYDDEEYCSEEHDSCTVEARYGFRSKDGAMVIDPVLKYAFPFDKNGISLVNYMNGTWGFLLSLK